MDKFYLNRAQVIFILVDIQEKLAGAMNMKDQVLTNCLHLIEAAKLLHVPILLTEQYPKGLGTTLNEIRKALSKYDPFEKTSFDCCSEKGFMDRVAAEGRPKILLAGMETHICILQTALGLLKNGYVVHVVRDAVCSRKKDDFKIALEFMREAGAVITGTETVLFQLLERAGSEPFRIISKRIK
ncbi:MAG: hydrolase [Desulfobacteraceae bacterium]|jgi:nicotinamidase-related amidase|nr:MAG: hydrolase [Desulfobacteraceae bacterium]